MTAIANHPHRVTTAIADARTSIGCLAGVPVWSMDATETAAAIDDLTHVESQLAELKSRLLTHADHIEIAAETGASSTANWHAVATRTTRPQAHRLMRLATGLDTHDPTRTALAGGRVQVEQAEAILRTLDDLPTTSTPTSSRRPSGTSWSSPPTTTPRPSGCSAGGSSRSSPPRPPTPIKPNSWNARSARPRPKRG
jgi:hypothetical protein